MGKFMVTLVIPITSGWKRANTGQSFGGITGGEEVQNFNLLSLLSQDGSSDRRAEEGLGNSEKG